MWCSFKSEALQHLRVVFASTHHHTQCVYDCASISQRRQAACLPLHVEIVAAAEATDHDELRTVCLQSKEMSQALRRITDCGHTLHNDCWQRLKDTKT